MNCRLLFGCRLLLLVLKSYAINAAMCRPWRGVMHDRDATVRSLSRPHQWFGDWWPQACHSPHLPSTHCLGIVCLKGRGPGFDGNWRKIGKICQFWRKILWKNADLSCMGSGKRSSRKPQVCIKSQSWETEFPKKIR